MQNSTKVAISLMALAVILSGLSLRKALSPKKEIHLQFLAKEKSGPLPVEQDDMMVTVKPQEDIFQNLANDTLNTNLKNDLRSSQLFKLTQAGEEAAEELAQVARAPLEKQNTGRDFELSLRIRAVEALDGVALKNKSKAQEQLLWVMGGNPDPAVSLLVRASLQGIEQGKPGKVKRVMDQMIKEGRRL